MELWRELLDWLRDIDAAFAFLLVLPFVVGAFGLLAHREHRAPRAAVQPQSRAHGAAGAHAR